MTSLGLGQNVCSTTTDPPTGDTVVLRARRHGDDWIVEDCATTRAGCGKTLREALADYCDDLEALTHLDGPFGPPVAGEVEYARRVLDA